MNIKYAMRSPLFVRSQLFSLLLGLIALPLVSAQANLPTTPFPLGRPDLVETRTIKELRPGLVHIHVERGKRDDLTAPPPEV